jgi:hypothetical protein
MMRSSRMRLAIAALLCFPPLAAFAQMNDAGGAASSLAGCGCCGSFVAIPIAILVLNIAMLVWVARDAKARGVENPILWVLLVFFTSIIGLIIYILSRPQGNLAPCPNCGNQKLQAAVRCPHCGIGMVGGPPMAPPAGPPIMPPSAPPPGSAPMQ